MMAWFAAQPLPQPNDPLHRKDAKTSIVDLWERRPRRDEAFDRGEDAAPTQTKYSFLKRVYLRGGLLRVAGCHS